MPSRPRGAATTTPHRRAPGDFFSTLDLGGGALVASEGADVFLARFDAQGTHVWSKRYGTKSVNQDASATRFDAAGNILEVGFFKGQVDFGGGPLVHGSGDWPEAYFAELDGQGQHVWSRRGPGTVTGDDIAPLSGGGVLAVGTFVFDADLGAGPLVADGQQGFIARFGR